MAELPTALLPHTVTVRPLTGNGAYGPTYGPAVTVRCKLRYVNRMVRTAEGQDVMSAATITAGTADGPRLPVGSLVYAGTLTDAQAITATPLGTVLTSAPANDGGLGAWQHHTATL